MNEFKILMNAAAKISAAAIASGKPLNTDTAKQIADFTFDVYDTMSNTWYWRRMKRQSVFYMDTQEENGNKNPQDSGFERSDAPSDKDCDA